MYRVITCGVSLQNAGLSNSAVRNTEWAEKKNKTMPHVFYDSGKMYYTTIC